MEELNWNLLIKGVLTAAIYGINVTMVRMGANGENSSRKPRPVAVLKETIKRKRLKLKLRDI